MALKRFPLKKYAMVEINQAAFLRNGMVISQTPLDEMFTEDSPCENGMWLWANKGNGVLKPIEEIADILGIVYTAESEYGVSDAIHTFALWHTDDPRKGLGFYPRVGIIANGDTFTSNCLQYDTGEFPTFEALETALKAHATDPIYVVPLAGDAVPQITTNVPTGGTYAQVTKYYTVPNDEKGVRYQFIKVRN